MTEDFDVVVIGGEPTGICGANARPLSQLSPIFFVINSVSPGLASATKRRGVTSSVRL